MTAAHWYTSLRAIRSLGSEADRPGSLAGLHDARREHLGQFFTPDDISALLWKIVSPAMQKALSYDDGGKIALLDNSIGSGRLMQFADHQQHIIGGCDIHKETVEQVASVMDTAGFECNVVHSGMHECSPSGYNVALINPPFSVHLEAPTIKPYPCTAFGKFGPNTSAMSHAYAVHQALDAAEIVAAVLPATYAEELKQDESVKDRLHAIIHLPKGSFREENTEVDVAVAVFSVNGRYMPNCVTVRMNRMDDDLPDLDLQCSTNKSRKPKINAAGMDEDIGPSITLPVTGDATVRVVHDGRHIHLKFNCGLTQAKVMNAVLGEDARCYNSHGEAYHRYPKGVKFTGQGRFDIEVHLMQDDPLQSFEQFLAMLSSAGGDVDLDAGLWNYLKKRTRAKPKLATPLRHSVWMPFDDGHDVLYGLARNTHMANKGVWGSPVIKAGDRIQFERVGANYQYELKGQRFEINADDLNVRFQMEAATGTGSEDGWKVIHEGRLAAFPEDAHALKKRMTALGIDQWLGWEKGTIDYQLADLLELYVAPRGAITAWTMGLGKARLAAALCVMSQCKHNLITVEAHLVDEMETELKGLPFEGLWQVIRKPEDLNNLRLINVISYERLRATMGGGNHRRTYAKALRRRIGTLVADEGHLLRKQDTLQSRALWQLSPKRRFILTGTPVANYVRDTLALMAYVSGDGTAHQPYGLRRAYMEPRLVNSMAYADRGIDRFREDFVTLEWVTNEFSENMEEGGKREIPKIANLDKYRKTVGTHIKRRLTGEPDVRKFVRIPKPKETVTTIPWDNGHLAYYLKVADEFRGWYTDQAKKNGKSGKQINMIALLARIQAVDFACNLPQRGVANAGSYSALTSKQAYAINRLEQLAAEGHKTIFYAKNPQTLELIHRHLNDRGVDSMVFHGGLDMKKRTRELNQRFRFGDCPNLLASLGVTQTGLNLWQADRAVFYNRAWDAKTEDQAGARLLRPQQTRDVEFEYIHLEGGIDEYQAQMVAHKKDSTNAGIDWATPELDTADFLHIDTLLGRFCRDLETMHGIQTGKLRDYVAMAA